MKLKNFFLSILLVFLVGCKNEPEVLFESICIGDNLETCLAKGTVQNNPDYNVKTLDPNEKNEFELANSRIASSYFSNTGVWFNEKNIIKKIELKYHQKESGKTAKEVFNFMTQYFCQRYQEMRTETLNEQCVTDSYKLKYEKIGIKNIWETSKLRIVLQSYDAVRVNESSSSAGNGGFDLASAVREDIAKSYYDGKWVELAILVK